MTPERWFSLTVEAPSDQVVSDLAEGLIRLGGHAVVEEDLRLTTVLPAPSDPEATIERARALLELAAGGMPFVIRWEWVPHQDWAELWKRGLAPRRVSPRLVVTPSWETPERRPGDIVVRLDPGVAFGTAEHATTRGCLRLLDRAVRPGQRVADVGSGSGILAIAASKLGAKRVIGFEVDSLACEIARDNALRNRVATKVRIVEGRADAELMARVGPLDGITANMESSTLMTLMPGFQRALRPGGWLVLGGLLEGEAPTLIGHATGYGLELQDEDREDGWWSGLFEKRVHD